jgi:hypothetical protein
MVTLNQRLILAEETALSTPASGSVSTLEAPLETPKAEVGQVEILKVLPHLLDRQGKHTLSPSLLERDAYQAILRADPDLVSGVRFDVNYRVRRVVSGPWVLRMEMRTAKRQGEEPWVIETELDPGPEGQRGLWSRKRRHWVALPIDGEKYLATGEITAWRMTIQEDGREIASHTSFLW